jgi:hypothetical protein
VSDLDDQKISAVTEMLSSGIPVDSDLVFKEGFAAFIQVLKDRSSVWMLCQITSDLKRLDCMVTPTKKNGVKSSHAKLNDMGLEFTRVDK